MSSCSCASGPRRRPNAPVHCHHRHQRQIDDDGADRAHPQDGRPRHAAWRQYRPRRDDARAADDDRFYVVECSSYQIDLAPSLNPTAGILLNLTPDHLDRHGTMQHYAEIKERLVAGSDTAIVGVDDSLLRADRRPAGAAGKPVIRISKRLPLRDGYFADGTDLMEAATAATVASASSKASARCAASTMRRMRWLQSPPAWRSGSTLARSSRG